MGDQFVAHDGDKSWEASNNTYTEPRLLVRVCEALDLDKVGMGSQRQPQREDGTQRHAGDVQGGLT